ncbi:hypothetical protein ILUMI_23730 [Ignelater luminosus]|uniref:Uncharacterized protein n=1 Tax=Ignelater luminosus TaxID=2038154 RepID=A0A8K0G1L6_IGNLU|nr:hypothetical protein ILUMI_23730 [Ignelater luminosus]
MQKVEEEEKQHAIDKGNFTVVDGKKNTIHQLLLMVVGQNNLMAMDTTLHQLVKGVGMAIKKPDDEVGQKHSLVQLRHDLFNAPYPVFGYHAISLGTADNINNANELTNSSINANCEDIFILPYDDFHSTNEILTSIEVLTIRDGCSAVIENTDLVVEFNEFRSSTSDNNENTGLYVNEIQSVIAHENMNSLLPVSNNDGATRLHEYDVTQPDTNLEWEKIGRKWQ